MNLKKFASIQVFFALTLCGWAPINAAEQGAECVRLLKKNAAVELPIRGQQILEKYKMVAGREFIKNILNEEIVAHILTDKDLPVFGERLNKIFEALIADPQVSAKETIAKTLAIEFERDHIGSDLLHAGIERARNDDLNSVYRMLGDLTLAETRKIYIGTAEGLNPTPDSLIGKFIAETGAATKILKIKSIAKPDVTYNEEKLVVAVSAANFAEFQKYFSGQTMMSVLGHAHIYNSGKVYTHGGAKADLRAMSQNTPLPLVILKPSEGERLYRYMELAASPKYPSWRNPLKIPWQLPGYTDAGVYTCCTHFIGNIPIGDRLVDEYHFPKTADYGNVRGPRPEGQAQKLAPWVAPQYGELEQVWTVPGHEQFSQLIGQLEANENGEFASPGWVIETLMGPTTNERVPVIFFFTLDHKLPIPDLPAWHFERPV